MLLDLEIQQQLHEYLQLMEEEIVIETFLGEDSLSKDIHELMEELKKSSSKIHIQEQSPKECFQRGTCTLIPITQRFRRCKSCICRTSTGS